MFHIDHIAISVQKLEESIKFYKNFGFKLYEEYNNDSVDIVMLKLDNIYLEIFHYNDNYPLPEHATELIKDLKTIGAKHFALNVKNIYEAKEWIENRKLTDSEIEIKQVGRAYFFIKDPNGILIEIIEES